MLKRYAFVRGALAPRGSPKVIGSGNVVRRIGLNMVMVCPISLFSPGLVRNQVYATNAADAGR